MRFVVTGCARSGTGYAASLFSTLGIACGHESVFGPGDVAPWPRDQRGESSWLAPPFLDRLEPGTVVLHQVRDPLAVIRSHAGFKFFSADVSPGLRAYVSFVERWCPEVLRPADELRRGIAYWLHWNTFVEEAAARAGHRYQRYRVEDVDADLLRGLAALVGDEFEDGVLRDALAAVPRTTNTWGPTDDSIGWGSLPAGPEREDALRLADRYGYA